jgi:hypothetical protein
MAEEGGPPNLYPKRHSVCEIQTRAVCDAQSSKRLDLDLALQLLCPGCSWLLSWVILVG